MAELEFFQLKVLVEDVPRMEQVIERVIASVADEDDVRDAEFFQFDDTAFGPVAIDLFQFLWYGIMFFLVIIDDFAYADTKQSSEFEDH